MARNLSRLFQVRHILVHEIPAEQPYKSDEIEGFFTACGEFLSAVDQIVATELRGHYPLTQTDMNQQAFSAQEEAEAVTNKLLQEIRELPNIDLSCLEASQIAWLEFAKLEAILRASPVEGGSLYSLIYSSTLEELIEARTAQLKPWLEREEGEL